MVLFASGNLALHIFCRQIGAYNCIASLLMRTRRIFWGHSEVFIVRSAWMSAQRWLMLMRVHIESAQRLLLPQLGTYIRDSSVYSLAIWRRDLSV